MEVAHKPRLASELAIIAMTINISIKHPLMDTMISRVIILKPAL